MSTCNCKSPFDANRNRNPRISEKSINDANDASVKEDAAI